MYIGEHTLNGTVSFNFQALDGSGNPVDPDNTPTYTVYKNNVAMVPAVTGSMTKIESQTGFYGDSIEITEANGFVNDSSYVIRVTATISGISTSKTYEFDIATPLTLITDNTRALVLTAVTSEAPSEIYDNVFDYELAAEASNFLTAFGCPIVYTPAGGSGRNIIAIIDRLEPGQLTNNSNAPMTTISVANNSTSGISAAEIDTGGDKVTLAIRRGETAMQRRITSIISQDAGMMTLEVR